jgi:uncharacterized protein YggT (Ycf19 family)
MEPMKVTVMILLISMLTGVVAVLLLLAVQDLVYSYRPVDANLNLQEKLAAVADQCLRLVRASVTLLLAVVTGYIDVKIAQKLFSE